jgi:hypothetical protein
LRRTAASESFVAPHPGNRVASAAAREMSASHATASAPSGMVAARLLPINPQPMIANFINLLLGPMSCRDPSA